MLEATSQDLGAAAAAFTNNSAFGTLTLGNNTYVELVNQSQNTTSGGPEAVYANALIVPAGCTLNLNGLNLYVRDAQIAGSITGGTITQIPSGGPIPLDSPTPGQLSNAGELDDWTFFDRGGDAVTVTVDPGSGAAGGPVLPHLQWAQVLLLDPSGNVLYSASDTTAGAPLTLDNVALPVDGTYTIAVNAAPGHTSSTGNYVVAAYDVTTTAQALNVNEAVTGTIATPYSVGQWTFSAAAGTQAQFQLLAESATGLNFSLTGPNGYTGFTSLTGSSSVLTLPTSGTYTLIAQGTGGAVGQFTFEMTQTAPTPLTLATPYLGMFAGSGQAQLFAVNVPAAGPMQVQLTDIATADHLELYARFGAAPTRQIYDYGVNGTGSSQSLLIPSANAGAWYILVYAQSVAHLPGSFTLQAVTSPVTATGVTPSRYGTFSVATLTVTGAGFTNATSVALVSPSNTAYPASSVMFDTFTQLTATVNLTGVPPGTYAVRVTNAGGSSSTLPAAFTVTAPGQANLVTHLILPGALGRHQAATLYIQYANTGAVAMPAPVLLLESTVADDKPRFTLNPALLVSGLWTTALRQGYSNTIEILASGKTPGVLEPGETEMVPVYYSGMQQPWNFSETNFHFDIRIFTTSDSDAVNWGSLQSSLQPAGLTSAAWSVVYGNLTAQLGSTWGSYVQFLDNEAAYLGQLGENVTDISQLWGLGVQQANNTLTPVGPSLTSATDDAVAIPGSLPLNFSRVFSSSVSGRNTLGPLGYGWSTPWQTNATVASDGTVTVTGADGSQRVFQPDSRTAGTYFSQPGDTGTFKADGHGGYLLTEANGTATDYNFNGTLNYLQDLNGNRITAGYSGGRLTSLTASSGQSITIAYNSSGLICAVTDSQGRTTTYTYDLVNDELESVTGYNGQTTTYAYDVPPPFIYLIGYVPPQVLHALTSISFPGGTHESFSYNTDGWLTGTSNDGGAQPQSFAYALGRVSVTNGTGNTSQVYYNEKGLVVKSVDPLGNATLNTYDGNFNLVKVTNALGQSESYTYNAAGEVTASTDFLGNATHFTYSGPFNRLASMTDANGNTTSYSYSSAGDLLSATYTDGTASSSTYDPEGDATSFLNANGQPIQYTYNASGQMTSETFSDGSSYSYTYDNYGNLITATDATGTTTFTYDPMTQLLTKVAYPDSLSLTFTYNAAGQRTSMVDQMGFTVNYTYDQDGRLSTLTDGSGNLIVTYTYDADGRLSLKTNGNGTYTTYQYDADGNVLHLINYAPGGAVNSRFDYTYNALGLETTEDTLDGDWTYTYDADGQLIHAVFGSTNSSIPNQDLAYSYDSMGNRITTVINGVTTAYATNNVNKYTSVGGVKYTYDANGNLTSDGVNTYAYNSVNQLVSVNGPAGTTTYTYNALGQRVASTANGQTTQYLIDPSGLDNLVGQYTGGGSLIADYTYGLGLTSEVTTNGSSFYDFDALGSTSDVTGPTGSLSASYRYSPFGQVIFSQGTISNPFQFVGQLGVMQGANGLTDMRARFYSSEIGRFDSPDPLQNRSGDPNYYRYVGNAPTEFADPTGLIVVTPVPTILYGFGVLSAESAITATLAVSTFVSVAFHISEIGPGDDLAGTGWVDAEDSPPNNPYPPSDCAAISPGITTWRRPDPYFPDLPQVASYPLPNGFQGDGYYPPPPTLPDGVGGFQGDGYYPPPVPPGGSDGGQGDTGAPREQDPNALIGPAGYGTSNFVALNGTAFPYQILFENSPSATAPAQEVTITEQLDPNLDWTTFQFTSIGWGDTTLLIPDGSQHYQTTVSMTDNGETFDVGVEAGFDAGAGLVTVTFQSIDPDTQLPPDVLSGFLPPEDGTGRGMGFVNYSVQPLANLPTGTQIRAVALVTFGINATIATDQVDDEDPTQGIDPTKQALVTIDSGAPTSTVTALPAVSSTDAFTVCWSGTDDAGGSGIGSYTIYVSDDNGPFTPWLTETTDTSDTYTGQPGHSYGFYSVATDNVGNVEATPTAAEATTQVVTSVDTTTSLQSSQDPSKFGDSVTFTATVSPAQTTNGTPTGSVQFSIDGTAAGNPVPLDENGDATFATSSLSVGSHAISASYINTDGNFNDSSATLSGGQTVTTADTTVAVASNAPISVFGQSVTFTITVSAVTAGLPTPTGTVELFDGTTELTTATLDGSGSASFSTAALAVGGHSITSQYLGDSNFSGSTSAALSQPVTQDSTSTALTSSVNPSAFGQSVTFTATVTANAPGSGSPTGTVTFYDGPVNSSDQIGTGTLSLSSGVMTATLSTSSLPVGTDTITAAYGGDGNFLTSTGTYAITTKQSIIVLDPSAGGALSLSGNASINVSGVVYVDSSSSSALSATGNAQVKASKIDVHGGVQKGGNASLGPTPITGAQTLADPLSGLALPGTSGMKNYGAENLSGNSSATILPGIYSQITVSGNAKLTLSGAGSGIYIIEGGGFSVSGNGSVSGSGVIIFNAGSTYPTTGGTYGSISLGGNGSYNLSPQSSGSYAGIVIFQPKDNTKGLAVSGNASGMTGAIYAPAAQLAESGNAQLNAAIVVDTMTISGNGIANTVALNASAGTVAYTPAQIRDAYGLSALALDGTGQTIAIADAYDDPSIFQSLDAFDAQFSLTNNGPTFYDQYGPASSFLTVLNQNGQATSLPSTDPNGPGTDNWEVEEALDVEWAHAIAPGAQIILVEANSQSLSDLMASVSTAASQPGVSVVSMSWGFPEGQAVFAADEAAYDSVFNVLGVTFVASTGDYGTADPEYPAFSPNVVAVGGTSLTLNSDQSYNSETGWGYYSNSLGMSIGSGGGISTYEPEPAYQEGVQSTGSRTTPDVSLVADPATGAWIADPYNLDPSNPFEIVGGTSLSAPAFAGLFGQVNQGRVASGESTLNSFTPTDTQQALYRLPQGDYNVIAGGSNGYNTDAGYNLVTGLGTPVANLMVPDLIAYQGRNHLRGPDGQPVAGCHALQQLVEQRGHVQRVQCIRCPHRDEHRLQRGPEPRRQPRHEPGGRRHSGIAPGQPDDESS